MFDNHNNRQNGNQSTFGSVMDFAKGFAIGYGVTKIAKQGMEIYKNRQQSQTAGLYEQEREARESTPTPQQKRPQYGNIEKFSMQQIEQKAQKTFNDIFDFGG